MKSDSTSPVQGNPSEYELFVINRIAWPSTPKGDARRAFATATPLPSSRSLSASITSFRNSAQRNALAALLEIPFGLDIRCVGRGRSDCGAGEADVNAPNDSDRKNNKHVDTKSPSDGEKVRGTMGIKSGGDYMPATPSLPLVCKPLLCAGKERTESGGTTNLRRDGRDVEPTRRRGGKAFVPSSFKPEAKPRPPLSRCEAIYCAARLVS